MTVFQTFTHHSGKCATIYQVLGFFYFTFPYRKISNHTGKIDLFYIHTRFKTIFLNNTLVSECFISALFHLFSCTNNFLIQKNMLFKLHLVMFSFTILKIYLDVLMKSVNNKQYITIFKQLSIIFLYFVN